MVYAVVHTENWDVLRTYASRAAALDDLQSYVVAHPNVADDIGLQRYENGRPAGDFEAAADLLRGRLPQQQWV